MREDFQMFQGNVLLESELSAKKINRQKHNSDYLPSGGRGGEGASPPPSEVFWMFFFDDKVSATGAFSSCSFNLRARSPSGWAPVRAHFETSLVMVSYYDYEILLYK